MIRPTARTSAVSRIPGAGPVADLFDLVQGTIGAGECTECETPYLFAEDAVELTESIVEFLREHGIELT